MNPPNTIASDTLVEAIAVAILNSDRIAGGWPPVESRDDIPDSDGYVRNATAALTAITEAGYVLAPMEPTEAMVEAGEELPLGYRSVDVLGRCIDINDAREAYRAMIAASPITHCNHTNNGKAE